jgi:hypothetical protein
MAALAVNLPCSAGGTTQVLFNFESQRSGSTNDRCAFRIRRYADGQPDVYLPGTPQFTLVGSRDARSWQFVDVNTPLDINYTYQLQIQKLEGGGTIYSMILSAIHYRR